MDKYFDIGDRIDYTVKFNLEKAKAIRFTRSQIREQNAYLVHRHLDHLPKKVNCPICDMIEEKRAKKKQQPNQVEITDL